MRSRPILSFILPPQHHRPSLSSRSGYSRLRAALLVCSLSASLVCAADEVDGQNLQIRSALIPFCNRASLIWSQSARRCSPEESDRRGRSCGLNMWVDSWQPVHCIVGIIIDLQVWANINWNTSANWNRTDISRILIVFPDMWSLLQICSTTRRSIFHLPLM